MSDPTEQAGEGTRRRRSLRYAGVGALVGALLVLISFVAATATGDTHWSFVVILALIGGAAVGAAFAPLFSLARDDGDDAEAIREEALPDGRADTHTDGAQAQDLAAPPRKVPPPMPK
jgi:hypothetical protein